MAGRIIVKNVALPMHDTTARNDVSGPYMLGYERHTLLQLASMSPDRGKRRLLSRRVVLSL